MSKIKDVKNPSGVGEIKEVVITVKIDGRWFDSQAIAEFKEDDYYKNYERFNVDKFDKDINVIGYLEHLIMSGKLDLNEAESDTPRVIRERGYVLVNGKRIYPTKLVRK